MNKVERITKSLRAMLRGREDRPEDKFLGDGMSEPIKVKEFLEVLTSQAAEIERLKVYEDAFNRAWEVKTKFDRQGNPSEIRAVLKVTTITSGHFQQEMHQLLAQFNAHAVGSLG